VSQLKFNTGDAGTLDHMHGKAMMREAFVNEGINDLQTCEARIAEDTTHKGMPGSLDMTVKKR
jgi:hypothetical protein